MGRGVFHGLSTGEAGEGHSEEVDVWEKNVVDREESKDKHSEAAGQR